MLEKPNLLDEKHITCLQNAYGLLVNRIDFLPLGADVNTAVYRVVAEDDKAYFVKLRRGAFNKTSVALPKLLSEQGIEQIIAPLASSTGQLWANLEAFKVILYPFIEGQDGYEVNLSDRHWGQFGTALKRFHSAAIPSALVSRIREEKYSAQWREIVKFFLARVEIDSFDDPTAVKLAAFLNSRREEILDLVARADRLALALQVQSPEFIVCHSDIHAGNILVGANDALYIVDWDEPILTPKERDLMYIGSGLLGDWYSAAEEETLFYQAYGQTQIDPTAIAYYRYERIVQDIAEFCKQLLLSNDGGEDRERSLHYLKSNFLPNSTIDIAYQSDKTAREY